MQLDDFIEKWATLATQLEGALKQFERHEHRVSELEKRIVILEMKDVSRHSHNILLSVISGGIGTIIGLYLEWRMGNK